jgi:O-acetyl-ADP-ribose deacetylase (regulator of RNase III)
MIEIVNGNLLKADVEALVNTVNTEGVMGKGIALQFRRAYPDMFDAYVRDCKRGKVTLGHVHVYDNGGLVRSGPRWIINFPTKGHWRAKSRMEDIQAGLKNLAETVRKLEIKSIALPPLGCGHGGLSWSEVRPAIEQAFSELPDVHALLFAPGDVPDAVDMPNRTEVPKLTVGRAALIALVDKYLKGLLAPMITLLEVQKLMYFLQEAGQDLRLQYERANFGPYARNLRHVLDKLEGHMVSGFGDGAERPNKPLELVGDAVSKAHNFLADDSAIQSRMARVGKLIEGFEDPFGLELLSSVHWTMCHDKAAKDSPEAAVNAVHAWSERKRRLMKPEHIQAAWHRLHKHHWHDESRSALH